MIIYYQGIWVSIIVVKHVGYGKCGFQSWLVNHGELNYHVMNKNIEDTMVINLVGGDWNMTFIFPCIRNNHPN